MDRDANRVTSDDMDETVYSPNDRNKSIVLQLADVEFQTYDDNSQDLFDDDESFAQNSPSINFNESHRTIRVDSTPTADLVTSLTYTPNIGNRNWSVTRPTVPSVPVSLLPFISTVNDSWNSELETPQAKTEARVALEQAESAGQQRLSEAEREGSGSVSSNRNDVVPEIKTPSGYFVAGMEDERLCTSPILNTNRRRRPKRRILGSLGDDTTTPDRPKKDLGTTEGPCDGKSLQSEVETAERSASDISNATLVIDDNLTSIHNSNIRFLEEEKEITDETDKIQVSTSIANLDGGESLGIEEKSRSEKKDFGKTRKNCDYEERSRSSPIKSGEVPKVKKEWGFITFTELCLREEEYCKNENSNVEDIKETEATRENRPITSSRKEDFDPSSQKSKNIPNSSFLEKDEPPVDIDEFSQWFYQSDEQKTGSNDTDVTKKLTKENPTSVKIGTKQQIPVPGKVEIVAEYVLNSCSPIGFFTAGGKPIEVNKEKLKIAEKIYNEISLQDGTPGDRKSSNYKILGNEFTYNKENEATIPQNSRCSIGFSTAAGKSIKISKEKLKNAEKLYREISSLDKKSNRDNLLSHKIVGDDRAKKKVNEAIIFPNSFSSMGFSTAGGKPIKINEEKLRMAEKLYDEVSLQDGEANKKNLSNFQIVGNNCLKNKNSCTAMGFSTASGKPIKVSEEKLKAAEKLYQEINSTDKIPLQLNSSSNIFVPRGTKRQHESHSAESSLGFTTAFGKPLVVNETALKKARIMYESEDVSEGRLRDSQNIEKTESFQETSSISGEKQTERLSVFKNLPRLVPSETENESDEMLLGFCRITGEAVVMNSHNLSNDAERKGTSGKNDVSTSLRRRAAITENLMNELRQTDNNNYPMNKRSKTVTEKEEMSMENIDYIHRPSSTGFSVSIPSFSTGFSTAGGETINISDQALSKAMSLLEEEQTIGEAPKAIGFSMANGKHIKISEDALLKARKTLEIEQENTPLRYAAKSVLQRSSSDEIPMGSSNFQTSKRVGANSDFNLQARKLFSEEDFETEKRSVGVKANNEMFGTNDRLMSPKLKPQKCWPLKQEKDATEFGAGSKDDDNRRLPETPKDGEVFTYSEEITASTEALLADEENSLDGKSWASEIACTSAAKKDRDISARPITVDGGNVAQEIPTSPIIGSKIKLRKKIRRNKKRTGLKADGTWLKINRDSEIIPDQISSQNSQCSNSTITSNSNSAKGSRRHTSSLIDTVLKAESERSGGIGSTKSQSSDSRSDNLLEAISNEMDDNFFETRIAATLEQEKKIRTKKKFKPKPITGSLLLRRMSNRNSRVSWRNATSGVPPVPKTLDELTILAIPTDAMEITAATAFSYKFKCSDFYSENEICSNPCGFDMGDGFWLIFDGNGYAGTTEFEQAFLAGPGVDPDLVPEKWVGNHYRWIVWKLASMDRVKFGDSTMPRMLTPGHVMEQLKYRYDREIDKSERPALRRIIEKDDPPSRRMILCVATVNRLEIDQVLDKSPRMPPTLLWKMELTDGWYSIPATIDSAMANLIAFGRVREGTKLIISRAELLNCEQGYSPLEIPGEASLKIHTNSTRRSRWDAKLGFCTFSCPIKTSLSSVLPNGGLIGKLDAIIARVYPNQYYEKTWSGQPIFRNNKCEDKAAMKYEEERQAQFESICAKAQANFEARNRRHSKTSAAFGSSGDPDSYQACFSGEEQKSYRSYNEASESQAFQKELESILLQSLPPPRKVTLILKVRLMGVENPAILTVWAPTEETLDIIKEGNRVSFHNVQTSGKRSGDLHLTAGHQSFVKLEAANVSSFPQRRVTPIPEVGVPGFNPPFGEFDTVGIVVSLGPAPHGMKNFEVVDLACPPSSEAPGSSAYLSILFWEGVGTHGFSDILTIGSIVACNNLQWRRGAQRTIPLAYSTEHSTFTRNPRQNYLRSAFESVKNRITDSMTFVSQCAVEIALERQKKSNIHRSPAVHGTPSKSSPSAGFFQNQFAPGMSPQTPQGPPDMGKDCTPAKYSIQKRLEKLQWYGEPPDLSPVTLKHSSTKFNQRFIPPVRTPEH